MIVTCEHCGARYKLDDSKFPGRAAKITCPRCRHLFVVYRNPTDDAAVAQAAEPAPQPAAPAAPAPAAAPPPREIDVHTLDFRRVGIPSWKVKVKIGLVYDFSDYRTLRKYIQDGRVTQGDFISYDAENWVPIEGIPDLEQYFIDVYLQREAELGGGPMDDAEEASMDDDGPTVIVGAGSLASSISSSLNAAVGASAAAPQNTPGIGSGSVAAAFAASVASGQSPAAATPAPAPTPASGNGGGVAIPGLTTTTTSLGEDAEEESGTFQDPFEALKTRQRSKMKVRRDQSRTKPAGKTAAVRPRGQVIDAKTIAAAIILTGASSVVGWEVWTYWLKPPAPVDPNQAAQFGPGMLPPGVELPPGMEGLGYMEGQTGEDGEDGEDGPADDPPIDDGDIEAQIQRIYQNASKNREAITGTEIAEGDRRVPVRPRGPIPPSAPSMQSNAAAPASGADHAAVGADALRNGDHLGAIQAYNQAVKLEPSNATHRTQLGIAQLRGGNTSAAYKTLEKAAEMGASVAHRELGNIDRDRGDVANANLHYTMYLRSNPADAADIQAELDRLKGG